ncbi:MAG: zinc ribbon domain-containing protein [Bacillota bacterium]|jgi:hypothetical protein|nr:zinc ribbon domain-containing protein [Bacillota bacterium]HPZ53514.1 zinc ribbon domain-containing protein [Bacillota bacterium]HQD17075.1 zinc ribbon domain-containing protein [Bacillota bacterium]
MAQSRRAYKIIGRSIQIIGLAVAVCGLLAGITDAWNEPLFSRIAGGVIILAGIALSITAEAFLLLYAIEENTRESKQILMRLEKAQVALTGDIEAAAADADQVSSDTAKSERGEECPECGCPVRAGKTQCPACGTQVTA